MTVTEILGWAGTVTAVVLGLPQLVRLARTRNVEGLSLPAWQAFLAVNLGWTAHGIAIGQAPQVVAIHRPRPRAPAHTVPPGRPALDSTGVVPPNAAGPACVHLGLVVVQALYA